MNCAAYQASVEPLLQSTTYRDHKAFSARIAYQSKSKAPLLSKLNLSEYTGLRCLVDTTPKMRRLGAVATARQVKT